MDNLGRLQKLTLGLIITLVWFSIMCFVVIFMGNVFKWSFLSATFSTGFFTAFGIGLGALIALAILHLTLTLNSIAASLFKISVSKEGTATPSSAGKDTKLFMRSIGIAALGIAFVVFALWYAEANVNRHKIKVALNNMESVAESPLAVKLVDLINKDATVKEILEVRNAMMNNLEDARGLSLLIPVNKMQSDVYYELAPWWYSAPDQKEPEKPISQANLNVFVPWAAEKKKFRQLMQDQRPFYSFTNYSLRVFYPVTVKGKLASILLLDTSRQASDAYLMKRGTHERM